MQNTDDGISQPSSQPLTDESDVVDLQRLTCRELLKSEGQNRTNLVIFLHGFMNGKAGDMTINAPALAEATNAIVRLWEFPV